MLRETMLGGVSFWLAVPGFAALPWANARSKALLWSWLAGGLLYAFVVVTVERVDYYLFPLLPLCALVIGAPSRALSRCPRGRCGPGGAVCRARWCRWRRWPRCC